MNVSVALASMSIDENLYFLDDREIEIFLILLLVGKPKSFWNKS